MSPTHRSPNHRPFVRPIVGLAALLCLILASTPARALQTPAAAPTTAPTTAPTPAPTPASSQAAPHAITLANQTRASQPAAGLPVAPSTPQTGAAPASAELPIVRLTPSQLVPWISVISAPLILIMLWVGNVIRPGSLGSGRAVSAHPAWLWLFAALVVWMSLQAASGAIASRVSIVGADRDAPRYLGAMQLVGYSVGLLAAFAMVRLLSSGGAGAGLSFRARDIPTGLGCVLIAYPVLDMVSRAAVLIATWIQQTPPDPLAHTALVTMVDNRSDPWTWAIICSSVIGAPIVEEVIYRGFLQSAVLRVIGKPWPAIFITSAIFAAAHLGAVPSHALAILFFLSIAMGLAFERTKSLGVPIVMHIGFNAANVAMAFWLGGN